MLTIDLWLVSTIVGVLIGAAVTSRLGRLRASTMYCSGSQWRNNRCTGEFRYARCHRCTGWFAIRERGDFRLVNEVAANPCTCNARRRRLMRLAHRLA